MTNIRTIPTLCCWLFLVAGVLTILACTGGTDDSSTSAPKRITGQVINQANGQPIRDALVTTVPPTEQVTTGADGKYLIEDFTDNSGNYEVSVEHTGYRQDTTRVATTSGATATVDFTLESISAGLITSSTLLQFQRGVSKDSFLLTSTVEQTTFSIQSTHPWLSAFPETGVIRNSETFVIQVSIDSTMLPNNAPLTAALVINTDNGAQGSIVNVQINTTSNSSNSLLGDNQTDCRRPDVLRVGYEDNRFDLIQFPQSTILPESAGIRTILLQETNPALFDSLIVRELGLVTITHASGPPINSTISIFEMNLEERIVELAFNEGVSDNNRRASLSYSLLPGIYCYYLGPTEGTIPLPAQLQVDISFQTADSL